MTDVALATTPDDYLDLSPEVLCSLLRRRSVLASVTERRGRIDETDGRPLTEERFRAAWL